MALTLGSNSPNARLAEQAIQHTGRVLVADARGSRNVSVMDFVDANVGQPYKDKLEAASHTPKTPASPKNRPPTRSAPAGK